jgi:hypothetical protein
MAKSKALNKNDENSVKTSVDTNTNIITEPVKGKRGRKSKKELMAALNMKPDSVIGLNAIESPILNSTTALESETALESQHNNLILNVTELVDDPENLMPNIVIITNPNMENLISSDNEGENLNITDVKQAIKKRGRKPKGGKIIQQVISSENQINDKPNVILHLKCSTKDLQNLSSTAVEPFAFNKKNKLCYEVIGSDNINSINTYYGGDKNHIGNNPSNSSNTNNTNSSYLNDDQDDFDEDDHSVTNKDATKEVWKKLKQLEHNLHINNVNNKKSACFWDSCDFDNPPIYIPKHFINGSYHVYGCFCSPECGVAYLMNENIDSSTKFERYHLFNNIYSKIYDYKKNIKPSPNPHYMLEKFYGNLSIQEYRSLLRNERLFLIVDKPLTRILPELHDDNDEFILNNKIIPSNNNYQLKSRMQKKKVNKNSILNEKFGMQMNESINGNGINDITTNDNNGWSKSNNQIVSYNEEHSIYEP